MKVAFGLAGFVWLCALSRASSAQDFNVDFGPFPVPSASYGAASGQVGHWNALGFPSPPVQMLDLAGQPTSVYGVPSMIMWCDMYDCSACGAGVCSGFSGSADDQALLGSWVNADCSLNLTQFGFGGLEPAATSCTSTPTAAGLRPRRRSS